MKHEKPGKKKKAGKTKEEHDHLQWVASNPCSVDFCTKNDVCVHHIREHGEPRDHFKTIPLCYNHHQGKEGIHHLGKREWRKRFGHEMDMLRDLMSEK